MDPSFGMIAAAALNSANYWSDSPTRSRSNSNSALRGNSANYWTDSPTRSRSNSNNASRGRVESWGEHRSASHAKKGRGDNSGEGKPRSRSTGSYQSVKAEHTRTEAETYQPPKSTKIKDKNSSSSTGTDESHSKDNGKDNSKKRRHRDLIVESRDNDDITEESTNQRRHAKRSESTDTTESTGSSGHSRGWGSLRGGGNVLDQLYDYKSGHLISNNSGSPTDSMSITSTYPPSLTSSVGDASPSKLPYESEYEYHVRKRRMSLGSVTSGGSMHFPGTRSGFLSRTVSMDSNSSSFSSGSPTDQYGFGFSGLGPEGFNATKAAEDVLLNLGFCTSDSFIPERFARNWYDRVVQSRRTQMEHMQQQELADMLEELDQRQRQHRKPGRPGQRHGNIASDFLHRLDVNSRNSSMRRSKFRRAATILTYHNQNENNMNRGDMFTHGQPENVGDIPGSMEKQDSLDQLKFVLERQASVFNAGMEIVKDRKRKQFASARQKSLPLCLETLSEEDEGKSSSKGTSFDKGHMKSFLEEEEERMSRSSSKDSDLSRSAEVTGSGRVGKHRDGNDHRGSNASETSTTSSMPPTSSTTSAECSDAEGSPLPDPIIDKQKLLERINYIRHGPARQNTLSHFTFGAPNKVMPLLQRQSSLDNIHMGPHPPQFNHSLVGPIKYNLSQSMQSEQVTQDNMFGNTPRSELTKTYSVPIQTPMTVPAIVVSHAHQKLAPQSSSSLEVADILEMRSTASDSMSEDEPIPGGGSRRGSSERGSPKLMPGGGSRRGSSERGSPKLMPGGGSRRGSSGRSSPKARDNGRISPKGKNPLEVEPALAYMSAVSIEGDSGGERRSSFSNGMLAPPTPGNLAVSPSPVSPITVIEADHLDNIYDSLDSGDSAPGGAEKERANLLSPEPLVDQSNLHPIIEEDHSTDQSRNTSFDGDSYVSDTAFSRYSSKVNSFEEQPSSLKDSGIYADDGRLSPLAIFPSDSSPMPVNAEDLKEALQSRSDSFQSINSPSSRSSSGKMFVTPKQYSFESCGSQKEMQDACVQQDDGTLSPIMFNPRLYDPTFVPSNDVFFACDMGTQYDPSLDSGIGKIDYIERISCSCQTESNWDRLNVYNKQSSYYSTFSTYSERSEDFEAMCYYTTSSSQTDHSGDISKPNNGDLSPRSLTVRFQNTPNFQMLCVHCRNSIQMSSTEQAPSSFDSSQDPQHEPPLLKKPLSKAKSLTYTGKTDSMETTPYKHQSSIDSNSGKRTLDTIIERLSKKTKQIKSRSRSSSSDMPAEAVVKKEGHESKTENEEQSGGGNMQNVMEEESRDKFINKTGLSKLENAEDVPTVSMENNEPLNSPLNSPRGLRHHSSWIHRPSRLIYARSISDNFEHRRDERIASVLAREVPSAAAQRTGLARNRVDFADSRNSSTGSTSAPASQSISRNMSIDSRSSSRRGSLVRQHCIELSNVLLNMKSFDSRDLESESEDEDILASEIARARYVTWAALRKKVPNVLSRRHTKRRMGAQGRTRPSFGMII